LGIAFCAVWAVFFSTEAEFLFEVADLPAHARLRRMERLRGFGQKRKGVVARCQ
jgi:hypothetical protein